MADKMATRQAYGKALIKLGEKYPDLVVKIGRASCRERVSSPV